MGVVYCSGYSSSLLTRVCQFQMAQEAIPIVLLTKALNLMLLQSMETVPLISVDTIL